MYRMATQWMRRRLLLLLPVALLTACGAHMHHVVEPGETLYSIGFLYGYDYRKIAQWNGIPPPYVLNPGQVLRVVPPQQESPPAKAPPRPPVRKPAPVVGPVKVTPRLVDRVETPEVKPAASLPAPRPVVSLPKNPRWQWPVKSRRVLQTFSAKDPGRKGIDIVGRRGDPVYAAAAGRVVYAGSGLVRYGQLIIIKHNEKYLSAYAHNDKLRVKEGDVVKAGQRIADMGSSGAQRPMLHFEIRRDGKPANPLHYLPQR